MEENRAAPETPDRYERLYAMLIEAIPSAVLLIDRDIRVRDANRRFLESSQLSIANAVGRPLEEIFPEVILNRMNIIGQIRNVFKKNQSEKGRRLSYRSPGVPMRIYYYQILPFCWNGIVEKVMFLMNDVTEQIRLSEEIRRIEIHLASVVESASDIILSTDTKGKILSWNPAAEKISGFTFNEVKRRFFFEFFAKDQQLEIQRVFSNLKTITNPRTSEWDLIAKNGSSILISWVCSPMRDESTNAVGIVSVGRDLTEHRKLEFQLFQSQKFAALGVMAGGIAHEIRNPLAICSSGAQFLMEDEIEPNFRKECTQKIHEGINRASVIIENLIRYARPSMKTEVEEINLSHLLEETMTLIANQAKIHKVRLERLFIRKPVMLMGNVGLIQQVFINLFLNAIQAMPDGGVLSISVEKTEHEVLIHVADTGKGISAENIQKMFDPFYTTSPAGKGTGLGLSICYSIIKHHSGTIEVDSIEGKGSTFTVQLPTMQIN